MLSLPIRLKLIYLEWLAGTPYAIRRAFNRWLAGKSIKGLESTCWNYRHVGIAPLCGTIPRGIDPTGFYPVYKHVRIASLSWYP